MNPHHMDFVKKGRSIWNTWRLEYPDIQPDLSHADLQDMELDQFNFQNTNLSSALLNRSSFLQAQFQSAQLQKAKLNHTQGAHANFDSADLSYAEFTDTHLEETSFIEAQLQSVSFSGANLYNANLTHANINHAILSGANLSNSDLSYATMQKSILAGTNLSEANLHYSHLQGAYLGETKFYLTQLKETYCHAATMAWTYLNDVNLQGMQGLETVIHMGPSIVSIDTLYKSQAGIPELFLQGCGVPQSWIDLVRSARLPLVSNPRCFLCYCKKDQTFVEKLQNSLRQQGVYCWLNLLDVDFESPDEAIYKSSFLSFFAFNYMVAFDKLIVIIPEFPDEEDDIHEMIHIGLAKESETHTTCLYPITVNRNSIENGLFEWIIEKSKNQRIWDFYHHDNVLEYHHLVLELAQELRLTK